MTLKTPPHRPLGGPDGRLYRALAEHADRPAVLSDTHVLTYGALARLSGEIEVLLRAEGVAEGDFVAVVLPAGDAFVATLVAVVRMRAVYVPIDASYPQKRIDDMLSLPFWQAVVRADTSGLRVQARGGRRLPDLGTDDLEEGGRRRPFYGIFTSGSTGAPKCAVVFEDAVANLLDWYCDTFAIGADAKLGLISPVGFDLTQKNFVAPLLRGAAIVIPPAGGFDPAAIATSLQRHGATHLNCAPSAMYLLLDAEAGSGSLDALRWVVLGGEPILAHRLRGWARGTGCRIANTYGPTECTDIVVAHTLSGADLDGEVPLGRPIRGAVVGIIGPDGNAAAPGETGELRIEGRAVGWGYINDPQLTADKFRGSLDRPSHRSYRTGDVVSLAADGLMRFHGRDDGQVKVRGNRVELGAVEAALTALAGVRHAAVIAHPLELGSSELVAFVEKDTPLEDTEMRRALRAQLPDYMIPTMFVAVAALPLTPNGKVDRRALKAQAATSRVAPAGGTARGASLLAAVIAACQQVLGKAPRSDDDFFDLGVDSFSAFKIATHVQQATGVRCSATQLFEARSADALVLALGDLALGDAESETPVHRDSLELNSMQLSMLAQHDMAPEDYSYNVALELVLGAGADRISLQAALEDLVAQTPELRAKAAFDETSGHFHLQPSGQPVVVQAVAAHAYDAPSLARVPFDLEHGPLARLYWTAQGKGAQSEGAHVDVRVLLVVHHIVSDLDSMRLLVSRLLTLDERHRSCVQTGVTQTAVAVPALGFAAVAEAQPVQLTDAAAARRHFGVGHTLYTFVDPSRADAVVVHRSGQRLASVPAGLSRARFEALQRAGVSPQAFFLAVTAMLLVGRQGGTVLLGYPRSTRRTSESALIGCFVESGVARLEPRPDHTVQAFIQSAADQLTNGNAWNRAPLSALIECLQPRRTPGRHPLFQTMVSMIDRPIVDPAFEARVVEAREVHTGTSKFDMCFAVDTSASSAWKVALEYSDELYSAQFAAERLDAFVKLAAVAIAAPQATIAEALMRSAHTSTANLGSELASLVLTTIAEVLRRPTATLEDNFVLIGGASLSGMRVVGRLKTALKLPIRLPMLFQAETLGDFCRAIEALDTSSATAESPQRAP